MFLSGLKMSISCLLLSSCSSIQLYKNDTLKSVAKVLCNMSTVSKVESIQTENLTSLKRPAEETDLNDTDAKKPCPEVERIRKRKVAVVLSYSGQGYLGLQRNPNRKTIEGDLLDALRKCDLINEETYNQPQLIQFQRAARTDKGVSALRQVLSMKLPMNVSVEDINKHLPEQIRVIAIRRVTKGFNSKSSCDARTYSYMLPTFAFASHDIEIDYNYRVTQSIIDRIRRIIMLYQGSHNFHNFTSRKRPTDPSARRFMISLTCSDPFVIDGMEFATIYVKGQSFMLHQIRKMVGLTIAISRGLTAEEVINKAYDYPKLDIPIAPSSGLLLEEVHYQRYNQRYGTDGLHEPLEWKDFENIIEEFRNKFVLPAVVEAEKKENSMKLWLETLALHTFDVRMNDSDDELSDDEDTPLMDGLIALNRAAEIVEERYNQNTTINNLDTLAKAATQALNGDNKDNNQVNVTKNNEDKLTAKDNNVNKITNNEGGSR
ncbi:pseudouridine synthase 1 [Lycorma delicatula]|uniref:pseudouridine synthase 1 n=1 Tax=Lycorma delicatula TaxID=130591 RepID=UPI003F5138CA